MMLRRKRHLRHILLGLVVLGAAAFLMGLCGPILGDGFCSDDLQPDADGLAAGFPTAVPLEMVQLPPLQFLGLHPQLFVAAPALFHFTPACSCRSPPSGLFQSLADV